MPEDHKLAFKNLAKSQRHPIAIYADFECLTEKICPETPSIDRIITEHIERHTPISYTLISLNERSEIIFHEYFVGDNAVHLFLTTLKTGAAKLIVRVKQILPVQSDIARDSRSCMLCGQPFSFNDIKVTHHDQFVGTGEIIGWHTRAVI